MPLLGSACNKVITVVTRKKHLNDVAYETKLKRCLSLFDLTTLGIGSTIGVGVYVLGGEVAGTRAGPAVMLSYFVAALASLLAALCYAEFGARVPRAGSAYVYGYVAVGEFMAFIIGWDLILEYVIGVASVARGVSGYIDSVFNGSCEEHFKHWLPINIHGMSDYFDLLAFGLILIVTLLLCIGVKESARFHAILTVINYCVILFIIIYGAFYANIANWRIKKPDVPANSGEGGFLPFGVSGMFAGAATCFYAFVGFDVIAATGEEVANPQRNIPLSIMLSLAFASFAYIGVAAIQTLMWPYYDQDQNAPIPYIFGKLGLHTAKWIVSIGALSGLSTALLGNLFPLPRVMFAMADDGLLFKCFAYVHPKLKIPLVATLVGGFLSALMAALFSVHELADMMSIGTLNAYILVSLSVLILRYRYDDTIERREICSDVEDDDIGLAFQWPPLCPTRVSPKHLLNSELIPKSPNIIGNDNTAVHLTAFNGVRRRAESPRSGTTISSSAEVLRLSQEHCTVFRQLLNLDNLLLANPFTTRVTNYLITATVLSALIFDVALVTLENYFAKSYYYWLPILLLGIIMVLGVTAISTQPPSRTKVSFEVPFVAGVAVLAILSNFYLMLKLSSKTWLRFLVWFAIGATVYVTYGVWNSKERVEVVELDKTANNQLPMITIVPGSN